MKQRLQTARSHPFLDAVYRFHAFGCQGREKEHERHGDGDSRGQDHTKRRQVPPSAKGALEERSKRRAERGQHRGEQDGVEKGLEGEVGQVEGNKEHQMDKEAKLSAGRRLAGVGRPI